MNKRILGIVMAAAMMFSSQTTYAQADGQQRITKPLQFSDISDHWARDAVEYLSEKNAVPFKGDQFLPEKVIQRSEFALMLHDALGIQIAYLVKPEMKDYFDDVDGNADYATSVIDLVSVGVFEGKGSFQPESTLTREEMIHYIMQAYKYESGLDYALIKIKPSTFSDIDSVNIEYNADVTLAQHNHLIFGTGGNEFKPKKEVTRAEAAAVISRLAVLLENKEKKVSVEPDAIMTEDSIEMKITIKNDTDNDVYINNSSGQKFDFQLLDANNEVLYTWSADKVFLMYVMDYKIEAGQTVIYSDILSGDEYKAIKNKIVSMRAYLTGTADFIDPEGYTISLKAFVLDK